MKRSTKLALHCMVWGIGLAAFIAVNGFVVPAIVEPLMLLMLMVVSIGAELVTEGGVQC